MSRSLGGFGGGGRALEYLILAMKSWRACEDCEDDISTVGFGTNDRCLERGSLVELELWWLRCEVLGFWIPCWKLEGVAAAKTADGSFGVLETKCALAS